MTGHFFTGEGPPHHFSLSYHPGKKAPQPLSHDGRCWVCTQAGMENEELCLAGPEDEYLVCHPSNGLRGSSAHPCPQVSSTVLHALSTGQPDTVQVSPSPSGLQNPGCHN